MFNFVPSGFSSVKRFSNYPKYNKFFINTFIYMFPNEMHQHVKKSKFFLYKT